MAPCPGHRPERARHGERGWQGACRACPATYLPGHRTPAGDSRLLPAHAWHRCWHMPPPHHQAPHRALGTGGTDPPREGAASTPRRKERHAPHREGAPEETGEPRRREPRSGAAMAPEGEASTHVRRRWRPLASTGVPGTARPSWGGAAAQRKGEGWVNPIVCFGAILPPLMKHPCPKPPFKDAG